MSVLDRHDLRSRVQGALDAFFDGRVPSLAAMGPELAPLLTALRELVSGGKRLRPGFCFWGALGAGAPDSDELVVACASLELFQACALAHDDVMDGSDTRRGKPSVHRAFEGRHREQGWYGDPAAFGRAAAILLGDLALSWSDEMLSSSGLASPDVLRVYCDMRADVVGGQYLDVLVQASGASSVESALRVAHWKAAKYTVERPLHLGAALAGAGREVVAAYSAYGLPLGEAFQLRDDVLGVFGDPAVTGKPAGDDLREGKRTALVGMALERATGDQAAVLDKGLGDPALDDEGVRQIREVLRATGAVDRVEELIASRTKQALDVLDDAPLTPEAAAVLRDLAVEATTRVL